MKFMSITHKFVVNAYFVFSMLLLSIVSYAFILKLEAFSNCRKVETWFCQHIQVYSNELKSCSALCLSLVRIDFEIRAVINKCHIQLSNQDVIVSTMCASQRVSFDQHVAAFYHCRLCKTLVRNCSKSGPKTAKKPGLFQNFLHVTSKVPLDGGWWSNVSF